MTDYQNMEDKMFTKKKNVLGTKLIVAYIAFLIQISVMAEEYNFVGARATGMAGANAASTHDASAQHHNPAAFGFMASEEEVTLEEIEPEDAESGEFEEMDNTGLGRRKFGWNLINGGVGVELGGDLGRYLETLADVVIDDFDSGNLQAPQNVNSLLALAGSLEGLDDKGNTFRVTANVGSSVRMGRYAFGVRGFSEFIGFVENVDTTNVGLDHANVAAFVGDITAAMNTDISAGNFNPAGTQLQILNSGQVSRVAAALGIAATDDEIQYIDQQLSLLVADDTLEVQDIESTVNVLENVAAAIGTANDIDNNTTTVVGRGFGLLEVPISYGHEINESLSLGITAKIMHGSVIGTRVHVFDEDNEEILDTAEETIEETLTFGIDLGILYRIPNFQFALVGHNLNKPSFDGIDDNITFNTQGGTQTQRLVIDDVEIDPQVTIGAAFVPNERFTFEINYEILETGTLIASKDIQYVSAGLEFDTKVLAIRVGAYKNLADDDIDDPVITAGIGFNAWLMRIDLGGAVSVGDTVEYDGNDYPQVARAHAGISIDF